MEEIQSINGSPKRLVCTYKYELNRCYDRTILIHSLFSERISNAEEWTWYEKYIVNYFLHDLDLLDRFTPAQIHRAIGLINVNAVALKFPMNSSSGK